MPYRKTKARRAFSVTDVRVEELRGRFLEDRREEHGVVVWRILWRSPPNDLGDARDLTCELLQENVCSRRVFCHSVAGGQHCVVKRRHTKVCHY